jgi:hypothetical protein
MLLKDTFTIEHKETRTGTKDGKDWSIDEFLVCNKHERDDGSLLETRLTATKSQNCPEIQVGGVYLLTIFITSREYQGKHYPSFRITAAMLKEKAPAQAAAQTTQPTPEPPAEQINVGDDIPF